MQTQEKHLKLHTVLMIELEPWSCETATPAAVSTINIKIYEINTKNHQKVKKKKKSCSSSDSINVTLFSLTLGQKLNCQLILNLADLALH